MKKMTNLMIHSLKIDKKMDDENKSKQQMINQLHLLVVYSPYTAKLKG